MSLERAVDRVVPAVEHQRDLWLVDQTAPEASLSYCLTLKIELDGELDHRAVAAAVQALQDRRDALRMTFSADGTELRIHPPGPVAYEVFDYRGLDTAAREAALRERLQLSVERGFDLARGPVFRGELIALERARHVLLLRVHHAVCDGWSLGVLFTEFGQLYELCRDGGAMLPPAPSFADFALDAAARAGSERETTEAFWKRTLDPLPEPLELPAVKQRPAVRSLASARMDHVFDRRVIERVAERARSHGHTLFAALFAALNLVLSRICGNDDVMIGLPTAAQLREAPRDLVGYGIAFVPVRSRVDGRGSFLALVEHTRAQFRAAAAHRISFGRLMMLLGLRGEASRLPLVSALFTSLPLSSRRVGGATPVVMRAEHVARPYEYFEILPNVFLADGEARVECQYSTALFDEASVRGWFSAMEAVLAAAADDFQIECVRLPTLPPSDLALLAKWNDTAAPLDETALLHTPVEDAVRAHGARIAASFGDDALTYEALDARANRLAHALRSAGAGRGAKIGLLVERGLEMVVAPLAVLKAGAAYVPLDPAYPRERLAYMLDQCGVSLVVVHAPTRALAATLAREGVRLLDLDAEAQDIAVQPATPLDAAITPDDHAYVVYTSGSTGRAKGVLVSHRTAASFLAAMLRELSLDSSERMLATTSLSFDPAVLETFGALAAGARIIVASRDETHDAHALRTLLETSEATLMQSTPSAWRMLIEAGWRGAPGFTAITGSEALRPDLAAALLERADRVWNLYGPTETTVWATAWRVSDPHVGISIGRPLANVQVWVLDERRRNCPIGVPGEICIGGKGVAVGYVQRPELTAERLVENPFASGRLYRTGDRGRWRHDGTLEYLGRLDFQLKVRGYRIEPGEVEAVLGTHPQIGSTVVVTREDRDGDMRLVAYVVCKPPAPDAAELRRHLRRELPEYMVPQLFVELEALPRLPNGKIDRARLPAPADANLARARDVVEPKTHAEIAIARIWARLLGVERVSLTDNFFDLGGHSLLAMSVVAEIQNELGVRVSPRQMVYETLEQLARSVSPAPPAEHAPAKKSWRARLFGR